jgi:hypothetical protein
MVVLVEPVVTGLDAPVVGEFVGSIPVLDDEALVVPGAGSAVPTSPPCWQAMVSRGQPSEMRRERGYGIRDLEKVSAQSTARVFVTRPTVRSLPAQVKQADAIPGGRCFFATVIHDWQLRSVCGHAPPPHA